MVTFHRRSIATQVRWALGLLTLLTSLGSIAMLSLAHRASRNAIEIYENRLVPIQQLMEITERYSVNITYALREVRGGQMPKEEGLRRLKENEARAAEVWARYRAARAPTPAILAAERSLRRLRYLNRELEALLPAGVGRDLGLFGDTNWMPEVNAFSQCLQVLRDEEDRQALATIRDLETWSRHSLQFGFGLLALVLALAAGFAYAFTGRLRASMESLVAHLREVADGNLEPIPVEEGESELALAEKELNRTADRVRQLMGAIQDQRARERALLVSSPAAIIGLDLEGRVSHFSPGAERLLGYAAEELIGHATPLVWRLPEELEAGAVELSARLGRPVAPGVEMLQLAASIPGYATECHYRRKDGTLVPVLLSISQVHALDGQLMGTMGTALDLREIKRLRTELQASEDRYRLLAERLPGVVYQTQNWPDGRRTWPFVSPQFAAFYGADPALLQRDPTYSYRKLHPEDQPGFMKGLEEAARRLGPMDWEGRTFTERPGEVKWIRVRRSPTPQPDGSVLWDGVLEDITTLKLSEEALRWSETRALEASRAKSTFLASMSHELRTPLSAILGYSRLMFRDPARSEEDRVQLGQVVRAGEHLLTLINDVLSLSKIEAGRMELKAMPFAPAELLRELESLFRLSAQSKGLAFEVEAGSLPPQVEGDLPKLRQVLVNLLGNAIKFTDQGSVRLVVAWLGDRGSFRVEDTGPGISAEEQAHLFAPFQQAALGYAAGGTGLGLHISQSLVALMGGTLRLRSTPGQGTQFQFDLPLPQPELPVLLPGRGQVAHLAGNQAPRTLLIVDDRLDNRDLLDRLLTLTGFHCLVAVNGEDGLQAWTEHHPDLILMDLRMPVLDGFEAVTRLRLAEAATGAPRTPVVAVSASVYDVTTEDLILRGFDAFLTKPIDEDELFDRLQDLLGVRFERRAPGPLPQEAGLEGLALQAPAWRSRFLDQVAAGDLEAAEALLPALDPGLAASVRTALRAYHLEDILKQLR